jgi:hypothetical protein
MATMQFPRIDRLLPRLSLPDTVLAETVAEAYADAQKPSRTLLDCSYNLHTTDDWRTREQRTLYRVSFRAFREKT